MSEQTIETKIGRVRVKEMTSGLLIDIFDNDGHLVNTLTCWFEEVAK
jgi:hypothetical protein|tara:strand:+ start:276 stop:416 length:141 start_codon:yes stop_codon:yes gene_type:complete